MTAPPDHGIAAVLGDDSEGLGNATFLARAASLGQHRDQYSFLFDADSMTPGSTRRRSSRLFAASLPGRTYGPPGIDKLDARRRDGLSRARSPC